MPHLAGNQGDQRVPAGGAVQFPAQNPVQSPGGTHGVFNAHQSAGGQDYGPIDAQNQGVDSMDSLISKHT